MGRIIHGRWGGRSLMRRFQWKGIWFRCLIPSGIWGRWWKWAASSMLSRGSYCWLKRAYLGRSWLINNSTVRRGLRKRRLFVTCRERILAMLMCFQIAYVGSSTTLWLSRSLGRSCSWLQRMVRWTILRGRTRRGGEMDRMGRWWTNGLIIVIYLINLFYRNQVEYKNNHRRYPISVERNWATNDCHECCHACLLAITEVNENYLWWYLVDGVNVEPQLDFWRQLLW